MEPDPAWDLRRRIYAHFVDTGAAPERERLSSWTDGDVDRLLRELHERHAVVLDELGAIRMALPFSAIATGHRVVAGERSWWANCAWDALAIPAALGIDASIEARWIDTGRPVDLAVREGELDDTDGYVHVAIPARHWWDDIVET